MRRCSTSAGERESHRYPDRNCKRGQSDHDPFPGQAPPHRFWLRRGAARRLFGSFLRRRLHREELPLRWNPFQLMESSVLELHVGAAHELSHSARDEDLAWAGQGHDASTDVYHHSPNLTPGHLDFPGVNAGAHLNAHACDALNDRARTLDREHRLAERGEEAVACGVHLPTPEALQLFADDSVVSSENLTPPTVTESDRPLSRADNVGEQDGRQKPVGSSGPSAPRQRLHRLTASAVRPATPTPESSPTARATSRQTCGLTAQRLVRSRRHLLFRGERSKQCAGKLRLWSAQPSSLF